MCTIFLFYLISRLANGIAMGNKPSTGNMKTDIHTIPECSSNLHSIISEEDYLPMPRSMRKSLLEGRKLCRVVPSSVRRRANTAGNQDSVLPNREDYQNNNSTNEDEVYKAPEGCDIFQQFSSRDLHADKNKAENVKYKVIPIVTVVNQAEVDDTKSKSLPNARVNELYYSDIISVVPNSRKSLETNRKYSLIDMRTGLKKSRFTLDLEDRLRKSKRELGFDAHLSGWKEFSFKVEKSKEDGRNQQNLEKGIPVQGSFDSPKRSLEYCTHNCQILGLCSVGRPQVFKNKQCNSSILRDNISAGDVVRKNTKMHSTKEGCPCDICTLAFLTDMNYHGGKSPSIKHKSRDSLAKSDRSDRVFQEKIRIVDNKYGQKSIEISVRSPTSDNQSSLLSQCSNLSNETKEDCTNSRIRKMFKQNELSDVREIYTNPNSTYDDLSVEEFPSKETFETSTSLKKCCKPTTSNELRRSSRTKNIMSSSSMVASSLASSSSLSTVLSYRRVRQIFQTIIEGTRTRKRTKIQTNKFKELEELGLGKLRNNRWYPSECKKTFSIWKNMNENVQGLQGEFKKHQRFANKF